MATRSSAGGVPGSWPYPPFGSDRWLGGRKSGDPVLVEATDAVTRLLAGSGDPGEAPARLLAAAGQAADLAERLDWVLLSLVGEARAHGVSWAEIGRAIGVSKQAAHARFAGYVAEARARGTGR